MTFRYSWPLFAWGSAVPIVAHPSEVSLNSTPAWPSTRSSSWRLALTDALSWGACLDCWAGRGRHCDYLTPRRQTCRQSMSALQRGTLFVGLGHPHHTHVRCIKLKDRGLGHSPQDAGHINNDSSKITASSGPGKRRKRRGNERRGTTNARKAMGHVWHTLLQVGGTHMPHTVEARGAVQFSDRMLWDTLDLHVCPAASPTVLGLGTTRQRAMRPCRRTTAKARGRSPPPTHTNGGCIWVSGGGGQIHGDHCG